MPRVDRAARSVGRDRGPERGVGQSKPHFLAFQISARLRCARDLIYVCREYWIASGLGPVRDEDAGEEERRHRAEDRPAVLLRASHTAERVGQSRRDGEDREHLQQVREWRRVLKRVRAVGVKKASAVRTPLLDEFLRSDWPLGDLLLGYGLSDGLAVGVRLLYLLRINDLGDRVRLQVLRHAAGYQRQRAD